MNTEEAGLLGSLIIHLGASCFPTLWTAGQLNCLWINSLVSLWLNRVSEVHLNQRNPIILARDGKHSTMGPQQVLVLCPLFNLPICLPAGPLLTPRISIYTDMFELRCAVQFHTLLPMILLFDFFFLNNLISTVFLNN